MMFGSFRWWNDHPEAKDAVSPHTNNNLVGIHRRLDRARAHNLKRRRNRSGRQNVSIHVIWTAGILMWSMVLLVAAVAIARR